MKKIFFLLLLIIITAHKNYAQAYHQYSEKTNKEACDFSSGIRSDSLCEHISNKLYASDNYINKQDNMHLPSAEYNTLCKKHMNTEWTPIEFPFSDGITYPTAKDVSKWVLSWSEALRGFQIP